MVVQYNMQDAYELRSQASIEAAYRLSSLRIQSTTLEKLKIAVEVKKAMVEFWHFIGNVKLRSRWINEVIPQDEKRIRDFEVEFEFNRSTLECCEERISYYDKIVAENVFPRRITCKEIKDYVNWKSLNGGAIEFNGIIDLS